MRAPGQFRALELSGHDDVGKQHIDGYAAFDDGQRVVGVFRFQNAVAEIFQHIDRGRPHFVVVFDHENAFGAALRWRRLDFDKDVFRLPAARQVDSDGRAAAELAVQFDVAARLLHEAMHHAQAEPRAFSGRLGGEKGLKDLFQNVGRNAGARIADSQHHILAGHDIDVAGRICVVQRRVAGFDRELASSTHGVAGIDGQVEQRRFNLHRIHQGVPEAAADHRLDLDGFTERLSQHVVHAANQSTEVDDPRGERLAAAKREELRCEPRTAQHARHRIRQSLFGERVAFNVLLEQLQIAADDLQEIVEVVRYAAGELADGIQFLDFAKLRLGSSLVRDVDAAPEISGKLVASVERCAVVEDVPVLAVVPAQSVHHAEGLSCVEGRGVNFEAPIEIVFMDALGPAIAEFLLHAPADEIEPRLVEPIAKLVRPRTPDEHRSEIGQFLEMMVAPFGRRFRKTVHIELNSGPLTMRAVQRLWLRRLAIYHPNQLPRKGGNIKPRGRAARAGIPLTPPLPPPAYPVPHFPCRAA